MTGNELRMILVRSLATEIDLSVEEVMSVTTCFENQANVSAMRSHLVSHI